MGTKDAQRAPDGTFARGNQAGVKHGGAVTVDAIRTGQPFTGLAAEAEREVTADLEQQGRGAMVLELATRLHTATRLYFAALQAAVDRGDLDALDRYGQRFGWLAGASLRAWEQVRREAPDGPDALDYEALLEAQRKAEGGDADG